MQRSYKWVEDTLNEYMQMAKHVLDDIFPDDALILTPFFQGKKYHGYWITDFFQVDAHFGDLAALRQLIDTTLRTGPLFPRTHGVVHAAHPNGMDKTLDFPASRVPAMVYD